MREHVVVSILLLGATWLAAQGTPPNSAQAVPPSGGSIRVVGCVVELNGGYGLTVDANKRYYLNGDDAVLHQYLGQKVRVVGIADYRKKPGTNGKAENMVIVLGSPQTLTISKIRKVADTCGEKR